MFNLYLRDVKVSCEGGVGDASGSSNPVQQAAAESSPVPRKALFVVYDVLRMVTVHPMGSKMITSLQLGQVLIHATMREVMKEGSNDEKTKTRPPLLLLHSAS